MRVFISVDVPEEVKKGRWDNPNKKIGSSFYFEGIFPQRVHIETFSVNKYKMGEKIGEKMKYILLNDDLIIRFKYMGLNRDLKENLKHFKKDLFLSLKGAILSNFKIEFGITNKMVKEYE